MKKILSILAVVLLAATSAFSQNPSPGIFNYQGVARNSVGNVLVNKLITLRLTIRDGAAAGPLLYQESRNVTTNPFGLFNVQVGSPGGSNVTGTVAGINLGAPTSNKFIQVEIDPNGGTTFINIGTAQIASVPYSLYSSLSNDLVLPFLKTQADAGTLFRINNSGTGISGAIMGVTQSNANNAWGVHGRVDNTSPGSFSSGLLGTNLSTTGLGIGVTGSQNGSGWGVYGTTPSGIGVNGVTTSGIGVNAFASTGDGLRSTTNGAFGKFGVFGIATADATGVAGNSGSGIAVLGVSGTGQSGVFQNFTPANTNTTLSAFNQGGSGDAFSSVTTGTGRAGFFQINNAASNANGVLITTNSTSATALSVSGPGIWGSAIGITNTTSGMEWRTSVNGTTYTVTKIPGATFSPFTLLSDGQVEFPSTAGASRFRILDNGNIGIGTTTPAARFQVDHAGANAAAVINQSNVANGNNALNVLSTNIANNTYFNATSWAQRGTGTLANTFLFGAPTASKGVAATPGGFGIQGTSETGVGVVGLSTNGGFGVFGASTGTSTAVRAEVFFGNPAAYALQTVGRVQISGQNAGLNRVLTSDATGNATWQTLGAGVGIGGGGTLNYVSKWTPDGSNLGNSQITDNASTVSVGFPFFASNSITVQQTPSAPVNPSIAMISASRAAGSYLENSTGNVYFTAGANTVASGSKIMTLGLANLNVGISTAAPVASAKLHVNGYGVIGFDQTSVYANGDAGSSAGHGVIADGEWRGVWGRNTGAGSRVEATGVRGDVNGSNYSNGTGLRGTSLGSGTFNWGVYGEASGAASQNFGVWGQAPVAANSWAGVFQGRVFIGDGTQGLNKVFTSDAGGNGSWQSAASIGIVSGSGTTNFVPKWTPNGTTLGNSLMQDDGTKMNIGSIFGGMDNALTVANTPISTNAAIGIIAPGGGAGLYTEDATGDLHVTLNNNDVALGSKVMTFHDNTLNVGIGTVNPVAKLHVDNAATGKGGLLVNQDNELTIPAGKILNEGVVTDISVIAPAFAGNAGLYVQRENFSVGSIAFFPADKAVSGVGPNGTTGVHGTSQTGLGVAGVSRTGTALRGAINGGPGLALHTSGGGVLLQNIGEANGYVLTSDASGNATWQGPRSMSSNTLLANVVVPVATDVVVTGWATTTEDGGSNFNPVTGEYTIPENGFYDINASVNWIGYSTASRARLNVQVNGITRQIAIAQPSATFGTIDVHYARRFVAGDVIRFMVNHASANPETVEGANFANTCDIHLVHR